MHTITVYTKPSCVQCNATYRALDSKGLVYEIIDLSEVESALEAVKELGYLQAPVVVIYDCNSQVVEHWSGFRPDKVNSAAQRLGGLLSYKTPKEDDAEAEAIKVTLQKEPELVSV